MVTVFLATACGWMASGIAQEPQTPGKEHEELQTMVGTWDATVKTPDGSESKGVAVYSMACNGMWLESDFNSDFGGAKFSGKGMDSYDSSRKLYTACWVDSMSASPLLMTGTKDDTGKVLTMTGEQAGPDGGMKFKAVTTTVSDDKFSFTMFMDAGGGESEMMTITYVRRKK